MIFQLVKEVRCDRPFITTAVMAFSRIPLKRVSAFILCLLVVAVLHIYLLHDVVQGKVQYLTGNNGSDGRKLWSWNSLSRSSCEEVTRIVYIKVPQSGSGTTSSVLINFGAARNLTFALSKHGLHFPSPPIMKSDILPIAKGKDYHMLVNHATYNRGTIRQVFPEDTKVIISLREPFNLFLSSFYAYAAVNLLSTNGTSPNSTHVKQFIDNLYEKCPKCDCDQCYYIHRMSIFSGIPQNQSTNLTFVESYIDSVLDRDISVMLIQEYFDESLVLLKRRFCWGLGDIIYLSQHINPVTKSTDVYTEDNLEKFRKIAVGEYLIYNHFYRKFWSTVWEEGPTFFAEVKAFKDILRRVHSFCARKPRTDEYVRLPATEWNSPFSVTGSRCKGLHVSIPAFVHQQKEKQLKEMQTADSI